jgi:hypothetical protein
LPQFVRERQVRPIRQKLHSWWDPLRPQLVEILSKSPHYAKILAHPPSEQSQLTDPSDATAVLASRARSYLQANCAHCHVAAGGGNSAFDVHWYTSLPRTHLVDVKPLHDAFGLKDARLVAPEAPDRSVLLHRVATTSRGRMPPLGSAIVDEPAVQLLREWIRSVQPIHETK